MRGGDNHSGTGLVNWYTSVFELIDMRSFSNLWFWIALAVTWSSVSHWVMGVPWDMVQRARHPDAAQAQGDLEALARINANRILLIAGEAGVLITGFTGFLMTVLVLLGFVYHREFAQALFLLGFPLGFVALLSVRTAHHVHERHPDVAALIRCLSRHRFATQVIGMIAIFVTAMWGMYYNLFTSALGS